VRHRVRTPQGRLLVAGVLVVLVAFGLGNGSTAGAATAKPIRHPLMLYDLLKV